jgi:hypothetical protein
MDSTSCANHPIRATARLFLAALPLLLAPAVSWGSCTDCPELVGPPAPAVSPALPPDPAAWNRQVDLAGVGGAHREAWWMCGATGVDLGTTELELAQGGSEANPLIRNRGVRIGTGVVACGTTHWLADRHPKVARWVARIGIAARVIAIGLNVRNLAR